MANSAETKEAKVKDTLEDHLKKCRQVIIAFNRLDEFTTVRLDGVTAVVPQHYEVLARAIYDLDHNIR